MFFKKIKLGVYFVMAILLTLGVSISLQTALASLFEAAGTSIHIGNTVINLADGQNLLWGELGNGSSGSGSFLLLQKSGVDKFRIDHNGNVLTAGQVRGDGGLCIGSDCRTSWPAGGGAETDPTVPAWAKAGSKPAYNFTEISGAVTDAQVPDTITVNTAGSANSLSSGGYYVNPSSNSYVNGYIRAGDSAYGFLNYSGYGGYFYNTGGLFAENTNGYYAYLGYPGTAWSIYANGNAYIDGSVGIGMSPGYKLDVAGDVRANAFYYSSDINLKKDINVIPNALDKILQLKGVEFSWKKDNRRNIGLIAQDVEKVFPELVHTDQTTNLKSLEYGNLVAPLIEAVKEQQKQIEALKTEIENLKNQK